MCLLLKIYFINNMNMCPKILFVFCILLQGIIYCNGAKDLPSYFPRCQREDPNIDECLLKATEQVKPFLKKGVPELSLPSLSPFLIPKLTLELGTNSLNYKTTLTNLVLCGLDEYQFRSFRFNPKTLKFSGEVIIPQIYLTCDIDINGRILVVPLVGNGQLHANITNSQGSLVQQAKLVTKKGVQFLESEKTEIKINVGETTDYGLKGLFDENETLAETAKKVIDENMSELLNEFLPAVEEVITKIFDDIIFKSISRVPYDKLYPVKS